MERVHAVVIGAGVVGLAVARALALRGHEVVVIEALAQIGSVTSARNSEVIHAGLYYPTGSLKARLCVAGKWRLYEHCAATGVAQRRCGKLIVASREQELPRLLALQAQGRANGVDDLVLLDAAQVRALEPEVRAVAALHSPSTGIVDSHSLMLSLLGQAEDHGAMLALQSPLQRATVTPDGFVLDIGGAQPMQLACNELINAAGLDAPALAQRIDGLAPRHVPTPRLCKGHYFALSGRAPFSRLVYPLHDHAGLGVHFTLDLAGQGRFGPDTEWLPEGAAPDYNVDEHRRDGFAKAIRAYWPALQAERLSASYSGIRPKIVGPGEPAADFVVQGPAVHGVPGLVNLFGIESPGLTACLALADEVALQLQR